MADTISSETKERMPPNAISCCLVDHANGRTLHQARAVQEPAHPPPPQKKPKKVSWCVLPLPLAAVWGTGCCGGNRRRLDGVVLVQEHAAAEARRCPFGLGLGLVTPRHPHPLDECPTRPPKVFAKVAANKEDAMVEKVGQ